MRENIIDVIKLSIKKQIEKEYEEYKEKKLNDLDMQLTEMQNKIIQDVLNGINILYQENPYEAEPNIIIQIKKNVIVKVN